MAKTQLARGIWAGFAQTENPFGVPNGMEENLRLLDDHIGLYTLLAPVPPGSVLPTTTVPGAGQIYTDGTYAVYNTGGWRTYPARPGVLAMAADGSEAWRNTGSGWERASVVDAQPAIDAAVAAMQPLVDKVVADAQAVADGVQIVTTQGNPYPSIAAGLAATSSGETWVVYANGVDGLANTTVFRNDAGVAVLIEEITSAAKLAADVAPLAIKEIDAGGKVIGGLGDDLRRYQATPLGLWPHRDAHIDNPLAGDGWCSYAAVQQPYPGSAPSNTAALLRVPDDFSSVLLIIPVIGQSLAGAANDNDSDAIFNPVPTYPDYVLMPLPGLKPDGADFDVLVPMFESPGTGNDSNFESPLTTMLNTIHERIAADAGISPRMCAFMASRGSRTWAQIGPGNDAWGAFAKGVACAVTAARAMGLRPVVPAVFYLQGEQDRSIGLTRTDSARHRLNMAREVRNVIKLTTGQLEPPVIFVSQPNNAVAIDGVVPQNMMAALDVDGIDGIRLLPPHYAYSMPVNVHPDSASYVVMGQHMAHALLAECYGPGYTALKIVEARWISETQIDLYYSVTDGPLVIDVSGTAESGVVPPQWPGSLYGFQFFDSSGAPPSVVGAEIVQDGALEAAAGRRMRIVRLTLSAAPTGRSQRVHYATRNDGVGPNSGRVTGARGCIRNSANPPVWASSQVVSV